MKTINPAKRETRNGGGGVSEDLVRQKPKIYEGERHAELWGESIPGRRRSL